MEFITFIGMTFAVFVTLATFSFLYKDNPFYKFAEHLVVGTSAGYFVIILWHNALVPNLFQKLADGDPQYLWLNSQAPYYWIPAILGVLMWTRFSKNYSWVSRWPMALYIGIGAGMAVPLEMGARVNRQLYSMMEKGIDWTNFFGHGGFNLLDTQSGLAQMIIFFGSLSALIYFYFSKPHVGVLGKIANLGIWTLMVGFGASFGYTVMARISLFINRVQDVDAWGKAAFDTTNENFHAGFQVLFWLMTILVVGYVVREIMTFLREKKAAA